LCFSSPPAGPAGDEDGVRSFDDFDAVDIITHQRRAVAIRPGDFHAVHELMRDLETANRVAIAAGR